MTSAPGVQTSAASRSPVRIVGSFDDLSPLTVRGIVPRAEMSADIVLALPSVSDAQNAAWQRRLLRHARACGCGAGAIAVVAAVPTIFAVRMSLGLRLAARPWREFAAWAGVVVVASLLAKLGAIVHAHLALRHLRQEIAACLTRTTL